MRALAVLARVALTFLLWAGLGLRCAPPPPPPGADELDALVQAAGIGGTVIIDKRYVLCRTVKPLAGQIWEGGGRLESCRAPFTYLTQDAQAGVTTIQVASGSRFEFNQRLGFGLGGRTSAIELALGCPHHWVGDSSPTTITFSPDYSRRIVIQN
jgi:hypothetical protein